MTVNKLTAAYSGSVDLVNLLLSCGANPNALQIREGMFSSESIDPMIKALDSGHIAAAEALMPHWLPDKPRLEKAKSLLEFQIKHNNKGADAVNMLKTIEARLAGLL